MLVNIKVELDVTGTKCLVKTAAKESLPWVWTGGTGGLEDSG